MVYVVYEYYVRQCPLSGVGLYLIRLGNWSTGGMGPLCCDDQNFLTGPTE
jgi:hypothetical protein